MSSHACEHRDHGCGHVHGGGGDGRSRRAGLVLQWGFVLLAGGLLLYYISAEGEARATLADIFTIFVSIVLEALPFMLLGSLAGGFIEAFVSREKLTALLEGRNTAALLLAGLLGIVFPVCECAVIPVVRRLLGKGVPFAAAVAYLCAGPLVNPIVAGSTLVAYGGDWTVLAVRMAAGYTVAVAVALVAGRLLRNHDPLVPVAGSENACAAGCGSHDHAREAAGFPGKVNAALVHASSDFFEVGRFLVMGAFFAGVLRGVVAESDVTTLMTGSPVLAIGLMMVLAVVLNLCSEADAFVAASFRGIVPLSGQMAFMVLGPMLDVKLVLMYLGVFRRRAILVLVAVIPAAVFLAMLFVEGVIL